jgi:disulfide bond formation protein DsbB
MISVETLNWFLGAGTIALQIITVILVLAYILREKYSLAGTIVRQVGEYALWAAFLLSLAGTVLTLYYSDVIGYVPCGLCWLTRIFFYPQVILFAIALYKKEAARIADYSIALSIPGALIALYTHYLQMGGNKLLPCPASGVGDCGKRYIFEFGYVTMPMMGLSLLVLLIVLMYIVRRLNTR